MTVCHLCCHHHRIISILSSQKFSAMASKPGKTEDSLDPRLKAVLALYNSDLYTDLIIECEGEKFKVHKSVMCTRSDVLAAEVSDRWHRSTTGSQETDTSTTIRHNVFNADAMRHMITFVYTGDYNLDLDLWLKDNRTGREPEEYHKTALTHIYVRALADYYNISDLVKLAEARFETVIDKMPLAWELFAELVEKVMQFAPQSESMMQDLLDEATKYSKYLSKDQGMIDFVYEHPELVPFLFKVIANLSKK